MTINPENHVAVLGTDGEFVGNAGVIEVAGKKICTTATHIFFPEVFRGSVYTFETFQKHVRALSQEHQLHSRDVIFRGGKVKVAFIARPNQDASYSALNRNNEISERGFGVDANLRPNDRIRMRGWMPNDNRELEWFDFAAIINAVGVDKVGFETVSPRDIIERGMSGCLLIKESKAIAITSFMTPGAKNGFGEKIQI